MDTMLHLIVRACGRTTFLNHAGAWRINMIVLVCPVCKSYDISFGPYLGSYRCNSCNRVLELYEVKQIDIKNHKNPLAVESNAILQPAGASVDL